MVALHKEQFGRGPTRVQSHFAGADALLCVMDDALLPAEHTMVAMGEQQRAESRMFFQVATAAQFIQTVETITGRGARVRERDRSRPGGRDGELRLRARDPSRRSRTPTLSRALLSC